MTAWRTTASALAVATALVALGASPAHAYSTIELFGAPADGQGGGDGRYFTGSLKDGLTCQVCHSGGTAPQVDVQGIPPEGYTPGQTYDIELRWPSYAQPSSASAMLEMLSWQGVAGGVVSLPDPTDAERCGGSSGMPGPPATQSLDLPDGRRVIHVDPCGASDLHIRWVAPNQIAGPVWLNAMVVASNGDGSYTGDGVTRVAKLIPVRGTPAEASVVASGCAVAHRGGAPPIAGFGWLVLMVLGLTFRRRAGPSRPRSPASGRRPHRSWRRVALLVAAATLIVAGDATSGRADEVSSSVSVYTDNDGTTVVTPRAAVNASIGEDTHVDVAYAADIWTSASIDVRTMATKPIHEQRDELDFGLSRDIHDVHLSGTYRFSHENDYVANGGALDLSVDLADKAATLDARFAVGYDKVGRHGDPFLFRNVTTLGFRLAYTQVIDPNTIVEGAYELRHPDGFQSSPYRWVGIGGDGQCGGTAALCVPETHPRIRWRHAFGLLGKHSFGEHTSGELAYRLYTDSWGIVGHTIETGFSWVPDEDTVLTLGYRFYTQNGAWFYSSVYVPGDEGQTYFTRARELGPLATHRLSLTAEHAFELTDAGPLVRVSGELAGTYYHYIDYVPFDSVLALSATIDLSWEL